MFSASSPPITSLLYPKACKFGQSKPNSKRFFSVRASLPVSDHNLKVEYTPWLIVGLGNPGTKYHGTRHNIGFEMIDQIARTRDISMNTIQSKALVGMGAVGEVPILLVKPQAYMNFSGESVGPLAAYYQVPLRHILMIYDDMGLPNGVLKLQPRGGHSHHNGLKNVTEHLNGCRGFPRLSIGIGNPPGNMDMKAFLLQKFSPLERKQIDAGMEQGVEAVKTLVEDGFNDTIARFNLEQKYKFHTV
uniref:Chloroplastic group IIB intron splicing facilitator CRS2-A, chloroplastic n=1 Tax=Noccaea caerulescens TaxID=107243 RepID=A0A1J3JDS5_NOCCA